jgi:hypothetical protein
MKNKLWNIINPIVWGLILTIVITFWSSVFNKIGILK